MKRRVFLWGLSNGIIALTIAALFWLGLALGPHADKVEWFVDALVMVIVYSACGASLFGAIRLRRRSGFQRADLRPADPEQRSATLTIVKGFVGVAIVQAVLVAAVVIWSLHAATQDIMWCLVALVVSLHFVPLGRIFGVRPYCSVGVLGAVVSLSSMLWIASPHRVMYVGIGMGTVMLGSAAYLIWKSDQLASQPTSEE
jgi:hypothetical protein